MKITKGAYRLLKQMVSLPGWAKTVTDLYVGGQILVDVLKEDVKEDEKMDDIIDVEFNLKQSQTCIKAIKHFIEEGSLPAGKHSLLLIQMFEMKPDET